MPVNHDDFLAALLAADWSTAERLLEQGANIDKVVIGKTPLLLMAARGNADACAWLLAHGASGSARTPDGVSAMHLALDIEHVRNGPATIDALIDGGAALDLPDNLGTRPLAKALGLRRGDHAAGRLIAAGVDINAASHLGTTPVLSAATSGKKDFVLSLLAAGADPEAMTADGRGLIYAIVEGEDSKMLDEVLPLIPRSVINQPNRSGTTPLGLAAYHGKVDVINALIDAGADPNTTSKNRFAEGVTPLMMLAMLDKDGEGVAKALAAGADVSARTSQGASAVSFATQSGNQAALILLAGAGADLAALDRSGLSPYTAIVSHAGSHAERKRAVEKSTKAPKGGQASGEPLPEPPSPEQLIRELHAAGYPFEPVRVPGPIDEETQTLLPSPLTLACSHRAWDLARLMVSLGARPDALGADGTTPLHRLARLSLSKNEYTVLVALRQSVVRGANSRDEARTAVSSIDDKTTQVLDAKADEQAEMMGVLLTAGASPDVVDAKGFTPLALAVRGSGDAGEASDRRSLLATTLLQAGANPWAAGAEGECAMVVALATGQIKMFHALWSLQKDSPEASSIVLRAVASSTSNHSERERFLDLLQSMGTGPWLDHADEDGNTPLIYAAATGQTDVAVALLALGANPNAVNGAGETAIMHAVEQHRGDIVAALRVAGADLAATRPDGSQVSDLVGRLHDDYVQRAFEGQLEADIGQRPLSEEFQALRAEGEALWADLKPATRRPRP